MSVCNTWDEMECVELQPVYAGKDGVTIPENRSFWSATPSGKLEVRTTLASAKGRYVPGEFYSLDFDEPAEGATWAEDETRWVVRSLTTTAVREGHLEVGAGTVEAHPVHVDQNPDVVPNHPNRKTWERWVNGSLSMNIQNVKALQWFLPGRVFRLKISPA